MCRRYGVAMEKIKRKVKAKVGVFYYDTETGNDVEYSKEYDLNCEHHGAFCEFMGELHKEGTLDHMHKMFGDISNFTNLNDKYYFVDGTIEDEKE
jgi:uncharacterized protein YchJ